MKRLLQLFRILITLFCVVLPLLHILFMTGIFQNKYLRVAEKNVALAIKKYQYARNMALKEQAAAQASGNSAAPPALKSDLAAPPVPADSSSEDNDGIIQDDEGIIQEGEEENFGKNFGADNFQNGGSFSQDNLPEFTGGRGHFKRNKHVDRDLTKNEHFQLLLDMADDVPNTIDGGDGKSFEEMLEFDDINAHSKEVKDGIKDDSNEPFAVQLELRKQEHRAEKQFDVDEFGEEKLEMKIQRYKERHAKRVEQKINQVENEMSGFVTNSTMPFKPRPNFGKRFNSSDYASFFSELEITKQGVLPLEDKPMMIKPDFLEWASSDDTHLPMPLKWYEDVDNPTLTGSKYILNPIDFCADRESVRMLVIVSSALWHFERRDIIRKTWGGKTGKDIKVLFHVGTDYNGDRQIQLEEEFRLNKDLVQVNIREHMSNLTNRMSDEFHWVEYYCPNVEFIMHQHDDVVPDLWGIAYGVLHSNEPFRYIGCGDIIKHPVMNREENMVLEKKRAMTLGLMVSRHRYPKTCLSTCIIMSRDIARILHYGTQKSMVQASTDMHFFGMLREKYQLGDIKDILGGAYMCQHVAKRRMKEINIEYPQNTVEGRIAAAYAMVENSPMSVHVHRRIEQMTGVRYKPLDDS